MSNPRWRLSLLVAIAAVLLVFAGGFAGVAAGESQLDQPAGFAAQDIDADTVVLSADLDAEGDADWQVEYRLRLDDETDEQAFDDLQADIEANQSSYLGPFEERIRATAGTAENATGREMTVDQFGVSTERREQPQDAFGIVTFEFEWAGFADVDGETIRAGDAVEQLFLQEEERLEFSWPETHQLQSSDPDPETTEQQRVVWRGPIDFDAGQPQIELRPATAAEGSGTPIWLFGVALLTVLVAGVAGLYWWQRDGPTADDGAHDQPSAATASSGGTDAGDAGESVAGADDSADPPPELLSNEEQVLQLLADNGGRMKQKALAEQLDWSAAKTSQVVGDLREDDELESFRLGRENVLTLPDVDIDGEPADSEDGSEN
ncbi:MAG: hypothetical protein V5A32_08685 [Halovenus sp.]